jgi:alanyl-tRNA synthetase
MTKTPTTSAQLRAAFLEFFRDKNHTIIPSSSLVPANDPTLLFTNAGMVQFKDVFLGEERPYRRAASAQRCVRAGGKHNDLENVGYTARHHTFFEMLGNFSFGDYFKREAIAYAWHFLTHTLKLPPQKLWVTVYEEDEETANIWLNEMQIDPKRFSRCGKQDNFWSMGDTGPCGPCTEIFYDHGPEIAGGPPGSLEAGGDRYIEIWNLVFMQFERSADGSLKPLPKPSVDTGMGLERLAAVMQGVHNNYDTDLFQPLLKFLANLTGLNNLAHTSLRVIADHIRSSAFLITDGVIPSNEGRGYVLRRIIRRALRHGHQLGLQEPFFYKLVKPLVENMGSAYLELQAAQQQVEQIILQEEQQFARTLSQGLQIFEQAVANLPGTVISGTTVFRLYDTYGFPVDLTADLARERGLSIDFEGFEQAMEEQRQRSQDASKFAMAYSAQSSTNLTGASTFTGYHELNTESTIVALFHNGKQVDCLEAGQCGAVVLSETPFYAESGGQVGDQGWLESNLGRFEVKDTQKLGANHIRHEGQLLTGKLQTGEVVQAHVDMAKRLATARNHTATHLLHAALRQYLGPHVTQKGSLVEPLRLRFDFAHGIPLTAQDLAAIEALVNQHIWLNINAETQIMSPQQAIQQGAMALFGEKYGDQVRVLRLGDFSVELCGGTHVQHTGDIGLFKIVAETGIAAGIRRIEALTGEAAFNWLNQQSRELNQAAQLLKTKPTQLLDKLQQTVEQLKNLEKQVESLQTKLAQGQTQQLLQKTRQINGLQILVAELAGVDSKALRQCVDQIKQQLGSGIAALATIDQAGKVQIVVGVTADCSTRFNAGVIANHIASFIGGKGGGRAELAQGSGEQSERLAEALASVYTLVEQTAA